MAALPDASSLGERPSVRADTGVARVDSSAGQTLSAAGNQLAQAGEIIAQTNERFDRLAAENAYNKLQMQAQSLEIDKDSGFRNVQGEKAVNPQFVQDYTGRFNEVSAALGDGLANEQQKRMFQQRAQIAGLQYRGSLLQHQSQQSELFAKSVFDDTRKVEMANVASNFSDPLVMKSAVARVTASIEEERQRTGQTEDWAKVQKAATSDSLWTARLQSWEAVDPVGALNALHDNAGQISPAHSVVLGKKIFETAKPVLAAMVLDGTLKTTVRSDDEARTMMRAAANMGQLAEVKVQDGKRSDSSNPVFDTLPINLKMEVMAAASTLKNQATGLSKEAMNDRVKDAISSAVTTGNPGPTPPTREEMQAVYQDEYHTNKLATSIEQSTVFGKTLQTVKGLSPAEQNAALAAIKPVPGEGFDAAQQRENGLAAAIREARVQRDKDPSGYAIENSPLVKDRFRNLAAVLTDKKADPELLKFVSSEYATAAKAEQYRLGVADPKLLPKEMAESTVAEFNRETSNGDNMATRIDASAKQWDKSWPDVYKQLATEFKGQLPDSFLTIPGLINQAAKEEAARLDHVKLAQLEKEVVHSDIKSAQDSIQDKLKPWAESMLSNQNNSDLYQATSTAAMKMALVRIQKGQSVSTAVESAVNSFVGHYEFTSVASANKYAVPKKEDVSLVTGGVRAIMSKIPLMNIEAPPTGAGINKKTDEENQATWKNMVVNRPIWVTNNDETGLLLFTVGENGRPFKVNAPNGTQMGYTWAQLRSMVQDDPALNKIGTKEDLQRAQSFKTDEAARRAADQSRWPR